MRVLGRIRDIRGSSLSVSLYTAATQAGSDMAGVAAAAVNVDPGAEAEPAGLSNMYRERQQHLKEDTQQKPVQQLHLGKEYEQQLHVGKECEQQQAQQQQQQQQQQAHQHVTQQQQMQQPEAQQQQPLVRPGVGEARGEHAARAGAERALPSCALCQLGREAEGALGKLLLFDCSARKGGERREHVHLLCAAWSPRAHWAGEEEPGSQHGLLMVPEEVRRAHSLKCCCCRRRGAAMGCDVPACRRTYHLPCAMLEKHSRFASDTWQLYCPDHASRADPEAEADDMREQRAALSRLLRLRDGQGTLSPEGKAMLQAAIAAKQRRKAAREKQRQAKQQQQQQQAGKRPAGGASTTPARPAKRPHEAAGQLQPPAQGGAAAAVAPAAAGPARQTFADQEGERSRQPQSEQHPQGETAPPQQRGQEGAPSPRSVGSSQPADTSPQRGQAPPRGAQGHDEPGPAAAAHAEPAAADAGERLARLPEAARHERQEEEEDRGDEQGPPEGQQPRVQGELARPAPASPAATAQQQAQGAALELLPAAVVALLRDVYGAISPGTIPLAAEYLFSEGVRSFSDVGYVDPADFFASVPTTKMLLNKLFVLHRQRDAAAAE